MEQILIIEDDTDINNMMASALTKAGYECKQAFSGTEAMLYLNNEKFSVIILDLMLPGKSGNSIVEEIKPHLDTPIIVVSAKDELDTKVNLLFSGADDYMTKPFEIDELIARVAVQIRKHSTDKSETVYHYKDMVLNITEHSISVSGHPISFTLKNILVIPVSRIRLIMSKIIVGYGLVIIEWIFSSVITLLIALFMGCEDINIASCAISFKQLFIVSTCCYIAVLPIIIITAGKQNRFLSGVIFSFFYGFCGIFLADRNLVNLYPMTTGLVLSNYAHDDKIIYTPSLSIGVLIAILCFSFVLLLVLNRKNNDL